ncbi:MAG: biotin-dependent carboxyltransferase family protein [Planctomycetes bacterium]|nr:biotin-dependent carboxyltransferase family protein [Planctomycetota bacterium]
MHHLLVEHPGLQASVQDLGRVGFASQGVAPGGAADPLALRLGNRLVGNPEGASGIELTLLGGTFVAEAACTVVLTGLGVPGPWQVRDLRAGERLVVGRLGPGARAYLCVRGGIDVPPVLGSAATHLAGSFGGLGGRALRAGDRLPIGSAAAEPVQFRSFDPAQLPDYVAGPLRLVPGAQHAWFSRTAREALVAREWHVADHSDRTGVRLRGEPLPVPNRELLTEGVPPGALQVPPDGQPIVLGVDQPTTGGYPKIATLAAVDLARLGQLAPRVAVRFVWITAAVARHLQRQRAEVLDGLH